jgi:arsenite-transporting ATPase
MFMPESEIQRVSQRVFVAGKGGVGKTTLATAIAYGFARAGLRTLLITTDPAAHTGLVLGAEVTDEPTPAPDVPLLEVSRIDPVAETRRYREWTLSEAKRLYAADTVERLRQELNSPCTEEVAVFRRFLSVLLSDAYPRVVFDTAPTGHTLRLLSLPLSYRQQLTVKAVGQDTGSGADAAEVQRMADALALLRDPSRTTFAWVVVPEATPIREAARAAAELGTIGIPTRLVLANKMLPEDVCTHPLFRKRYELQQGHVRTMAGHFPGAEVVPVPLQAGEVIGLNAVEALLQSAPGLVQIGLAREVEA